MRNVRGTLSVSVNIYTLHRGCNFIDCITTVVWLFRHLLVRALPSSLGQTHRQVNSVVALVECLHWASRHAALFCSMLTVFSDAIPRRLRHAFLHNDVLTDCNDPFYNIQEVLDPAFCAATKSPQDIVLALSKKKLSALPVRSTTNFLPSAG